ncbi:MAG: hypothetical protein HYV02_04915 [Deltaproteobacteria bacterium]|nr:hypothetical protein [Deltaproteobacteria bacterium]
MTPRNLLHALSLLLPAILGSAGCGGCPHNGAVTVVSSPPVQLTYAPPPPPPPPPMKKVQESLVSASPPKKAPPRVAEVPPDEILSDLTSSGPPPVPPSAFQADDLTMRLREKMAEAYGGDVSRVPNATIYLSNDTIEGFIDFYEERGYTVTRIAVPVTRILQPVLRDKPELAEKIHLDDYEGITIHQVMVEGTGVSAADKYIDPDTYEVVDRLFVTEMPLK